MISKNEIKKRILDHYGITDSLWLNSNYPIHTLGTKLESISNNVSFEAQLLNDHTGYDCMFDLPFLLYKYDISEWITTEFNILFDEDKIPYYFDDFCQLICKQLNNITHISNLELFPTGSETIDINSSIERKQLIEQALKNGYLISNVIWVENDAKVKRFQSPAELEEWYNSEITTMCIEKTEYQKIDDTHPITYIYGYFT